VYPLLRTQSDYDGNCGKLLVISAIKYLNSKVYHSVLKLLNFFQGLLFTVNILKFLCSEIRVDRDMAGYVRYCGKWMPEKQLHRKTPATPARLDAVCEG